MLRFRYSVVVYLITLHGADKAMHRKRFWTFLGTMRHYRECSDLMSRGMRIEVHRHR